MNADPATDVAIVGLEGPAGSPRTCSRARGSRRLRSRRFHVSIPGSMTLDELRNDVRSWMSSPKSSHEVPTFRTGPSRTRLPAPFPTLMVNAIGGTTMHYPGLSIRLQPWNFRSRSAAIERYGTSAIPEGSTLADWPLDYAELEPYYDAVERAIGVAGSAAIGRLRHRSGGKRLRGSPRPRLSAASAPPNRLDPAHGRSGARARLASVSGPGGGEQRVYNGNPTCTYCGFCSSNGCYRGAKGSTDANVIRWAEAAGGCASSRTRA